MTCPIQSPLQVQRNPLIKPRRPASNVPTILDGTGSRTSATSRLAPVAPNAKASSSALDNHCSPGSSPIMTYGTIGTSSATIMTNVVRNGPDIGLAGFSVFVVHSRNDYNTSV